MVERVKRRAASWYWPVAAMLLLTAAAWVPLYLQRRRAHLPNVDDYLYALMSLRLAHAGSIGNFVHDFLHTGQTAPLVLLFSAPGAVHGVDGAVALQLPLLLLLAGGAWFLARIWVGPWPAALIGLAAATNQAVIGWSVMVHFSVTASACCLWMLAAYLRSEGFQNWRWALLTGASVGLLLLSRSLAPVYVAPFVVVALIDVVRRRRLPWAQIGAALAVAVAVAGPWWLVSGGDALHYLRSSGYQASSGLTDTGAHLSLHSLLARVRWTLGDLGTLQALILLAAPLIAVAHRRRMPGAVVVASWLGLTLVVLATSSNIGTGFGLPLIAVAITLGGALVFRREPQQTTAAEAGRDTEQPAPSAYTVATRNPSSWKRRTLLTTAILALTLLVVILLVAAVAKNARPDLSWPLAAFAVLFVGALMTFRSIAAVVVIAIVAVGIAAQLFGETSQWWLGVPYRRMALQNANGAKLPNIDAVHRQVAHAIVGRTTLLVRDDDFLNGNGLNYTAATEHLDQRLISAPFGDAQAGVRELADAQLLIAGTSPAPYHDYAKTVEAAAERDGWTKIRSWSPACGNTIDLWARKVTSPPKHSRHKRSPYEVAVLTDSPSAYWRLDDTTCSAADDSGHNNDAAVVGQARLRAPALVAGGGMSIHLDGNDMVTFADSPSLSPRRATSIEAWVKPARVSTAIGSAWQLVSIYNDVLLYLTGGPAPKFVFAIYDAAHSSYEPSATSTVKVKAGKIYHVVGTYDGARIRIYVNGVLQSTTRYDSGLSNALYGGAIAYQGWGELPSPHFDGNIDEVAIYGRALKSNAIAMHYRIGRRGAGG
jgi:hypothetical protein